jgi:hypothetical protein
VIKSSNTGISPRSNRLIVPSPSLFEGRWWSAMVGFNVESGVKVKLKNFNINSYTTDSSTLQMHPPPKRTHNPLVWPN